MQNTENKFKHDGDVCFDLYADAVNEIINCLADNPEKYGKLKFSF